jgi:hypothetical protein
MLRTPTAWIVSLSVVLVGLGTAPSPGASEAKHTGTVVTVEPDGHRIAIEEMGPWVGPKQGIVKRWIALVPETTVTEVSRSGRPATDGWPGDFASVPLAPAAIKPGDFVTVTTHARGGRLTARSVQVLRPSPESTAR